MIEAFSISGDYRVQARRTATPSALAGRWLVACERRLSSDTANAHLQQHKYWLGNAFINLRPAIITYRQGQFERSRDILYKRSLFTPSPGTAPMPADIIDVTKAERLWNRRQRHLIDLFGDAHVCACDEYMRDLSTIVSNEYFLHEMGHFTGYDVLAKYSEGYFSVDGRTAWPLVYLEELRADLHAFGFAAALLPATDAIAVFLYNIFLRFGVHRAGVSSSGIAPYGLVPYLLFHVLRHIGLLHVNRESKRFCFDSLAQEDLLVAMSDCAAHALREITALELACRSPIDAAIAGARYVRARVLDSVSASDFADVMSA